MTTMAAKKADGEVRAELRRDHVGHEAAEHDELPVGEVDDPVDAKDEGEARRRYGKVHAVGGAVDQLLGERGHGIMALPAGDKVWTSENRAAKRSGRRDRAGAPHGAEPGSRSERPAIEGKRGAARTLAGRHRPSVFSTCGTRPRPSPRRSYFGSLSPYTYGP